MLEFFFDLLDIMGDELKKILRELNKKSDKSLIKKIKKGKKLLILSYIFIIMWFILNYFFFEIYLDFKIKI